MRWKLMRNMALMPILALIAVGCGDPSGDSTPAGGGSEEVDTLKIEVRPRADAEPLTATLRCTTPPEATGFISDAEKACETVRATKHVLIHGPPDNVMCTEIYGGPQRARITGTVDKQRVDLEVTREDGCAIALWDELEPLLGAPPSL
jgi:hypothetical protein